jgi:hypothetical protein
MTISLAQFITNEAGQAVSYDNVPANTGQCEQLVQEYCVQVLGWKPPLIPTAVEWWTNPTVLANFTQISVGQEQPGDIGVFGASAVINSPIAGHIDIVVTPASGGYVGFDSNWGNVNNAAGYPVAHETNHTFTDVLGFLRYNGGSMTPEEQAALANAQLYQNAVTQSNAWTDPNGFSDDVTRVTAHINNLMADRIAVTEALGLPVTTDAADLTTAINALKGSSTPTVLAPGVYEVQ